MHEKIVRLAAAPLVEGWFDTVGMLVSDATLRRDVDELRELKLLLEARHDAKDPELRGRLRGVLDAVDAAIGRLPG